jgi:E3 ubiquitin-protein ligase SIAH1
MAGNLLNTTTSVLHDILECTICLDVPASPIHSCTNGHIVCGICLDKVKKCGMCQGDLSVSTFAERLSKHVNKHENNVLY